MVLYVYIDSMYVQGYDYNVCYYFVWVKIKHNNQSVNKSIKQTNTRVSLIVNSVVN